MRAILRITVGFTLACLVIPACDRERHVDYYSNGGKSWAKKGEYDKAIEDYSQALRLKPDYADAYIGRGNARQGKNEYDKAIADFNQTLKIDPDFAHTYCNRGLAWSVMRVRQGNCGPQPMQASQAR